MKFLEKVVLLPSPVAYFNSTWKTDSWKICVVLSTLQAALTSSMSAKVTVYELNCEIIYTLIFEIAKPYANQARSQLDNWGVHIHIFVFCIIHFFWNRLFLQFVNTNIWIWAPPIIELATHMAQIALAYWLLNGLIFFYILVQHSFHSEPVNLGRNIFDVILMRNLRRIKYLHWKISNNKIYWNTSIDLV